MTEIPISGTSDDSEHIDAAALREQTDRMIDALTDPRYIEAVRAVRNSPDDSRIAEAAKNLSPDALRELGVPIPAGMRISSRYFEPDLPGEIELGDVVGSGSGMAGSLDKAAPGLLDRLRVEEPELFKTLTIPTSDPDSTKFAVKHCACGGTPVPVMFNPVVCGGTGVNLPL